MPADFEKQSYWRERFASETAFEWLTSSATFMSIAEPYLARLGRPPEDTRVLQLGCGTSDLQNHFRTRGYLDVTNVDYEPLAIERGRQLEQRAFGDVRMNYAVADATQLTHDLPEPRKFDVVVDKSTVDAVSCAGTSVFLRMVENVRACLAAHDGFWISLSYSSYRFDLDDLPFHVQTIGKVPTPKSNPTEPDIFHWCYLLRPN
ncbi:S-adenosyl-L-methionine-dependent methyltransferase [Xylariomycetidae sp. FL0641]|nr:S-adenosyl-L-methionine-dependent methyltransferase [Xylariomycetidae sp. FL0641]